MAQAGNSTLGDVTLRVAARRTFQTAGLGIVGNPHRFLAFVMDLAQEDSLELLVLIRNCDDELVAPLARAARVGTAEEVQGAYFKVRQLLIGRGLDQVLSGRIAAQVALGMSDALGLPEPRELVKALSQTPQHGADAAPERAGSVLSRGRMKADSEARALERERRLREHERRLAERERAIAAREASARAAASRAPYGLPNTPYAASGAQGGMGPAGTYQQGASMGYGAVPSSGNGQWGGSQGMQPMPGVPAVTTQGKGGRKRGAAARVALICVMVLAALTGAAIGLGLVERLGGGSEEPQSLSSQIAVESGGRIEPTKNDAKAYLAMYEVTNNASLSADVTLTIEYLDSGGETLKSVDVWAGVLDPGEEKFVSSTYGNELATESRATSVSAASTSHGSLKGSLDWEERARDEDELVIRVKNAGQSTAVVREGTAYGTKGEGENPAIYSPWVADTEPGVEIAPGESVDLTFGGEWGKWDYDYDIYLYGYME